jgi:integrase
MGEPHMPRQPNTTTPKYRKHRASGQAIVTINGRDYYLGPHDTAASKREYDRLIAEWLANGRQDQLKVAGLTILELLAAYWRFAETYYRKDGRPTSEVSSIRDSMRFLKKLYGQTPAVEFGPLRLKAVREEMIGRGWMRTSINRRIHRIKRMFAWGVENELVPSHVYDGLRVIAGLKAGRTEAKESKPVRPVDNVLVDATIEQVGPVVGSMIELQRLTGMRSGELTSIRSRDLDTSGKIWVYKPESHKTQHHGHVREIYLGPQAQQLLKPFLSTDLEAYIFSPIAAEAQRRAKMREKRKTRVQPSQINRRRRKPRWKPGDRYDTQSYKRAVSRGCQRAFPLPEELRRKYGETHEDWMVRLTGKERDQVRAWKTAHHWHPHQLRHSAATRLRKEFGIEAARVVLGHRSASVTEIYAEMDSAKAADIMSRVG